MTGGGRRPDPILEIVAYDPRWPAQFEHERALLADVLPSALLDHIGSTSVPGMSAKPTLDILVVLPVAADALERGEALEAAGYEHKPRSFADDPDHHFFRDYLVARPEVAARYEAEKLALAERVGYDREAYVAAKERLVAALMADAYRWRS